VVIKAAPIGLINSILTFCPEIANNISIPIIAGGFVRAYFAGERPSDLDLYFRNSQDLEIVLENLKENGWNIGFQTDRATSMVKNGRLVQLISIVYGDPSHVIELFDFTVCSAAVILYTENSRENEEIFAGKIFLHDDFMEHLAGRVLVYTGSQYPLSSLKRAFKYVKRGYNICDESIIALAESVSNSNIFSSSVEELEEHIMGMDPDGGRRIRVID